MVLCDLAGDINEKRELTSEKSNLLEELDSLKGR
jgi:hypothetical protein